MGSGQDARRSERGARLGHHLSGRLGLGRHRVPAALGMDLVEARGESFGQSPGVRENERGSVCLDEVDDPGLDVGPDGRAGARRRSDGGHQVGHVLDRHLDAQLPLLGRLCADDAHRRPTCQEAGRLLRGLDRRGQPYPGDGSTSQVIEAGQAHGQMCPPLGPRDRMDLIDDHRLDIGQDGAGLRGEQEEQGLRCGDEDVRRAAGHRPSLSGGGVAGAHAHCDPGFVTAQPHGLGGDAGQR